MKGRALQFLGLVLGSWVGARAMILWPGSAVPVAAGPAAAVVADFDRVSSATAVINLAKPVPTLTRARAAAVAWASPRRITPPLAAAASATVAVPSPPTPDDRTPSIPPPLPPAPYAPGPGRLSGSLWAIARGGSREALVGGQLGGSQAGVRVAYALGEGRRTALAARLSAPARGRGAEAALGVEWRPFDAPVRVIAEQRIPLDGGRGGPTLLGVAGLNPVRIGAWSAEGYVQGGAIARDGIEGFADGAARLTRRIGAVDVGVGSWGGAQRGAARIDVGPTVGVVIPSTRFRLTLDWRARIAGRARPGSGPALSVGTDF